MSRLTHLDDQGRAHMVDVGGKPVTGRVAAASGKITLSRQALELIREGKAAKGDVLATARIAGIMAAKRTGELIPLCHPIGLDSITVTFAFEDDAIRVVARAAVEAKTGVEMEAMTAASIALLTIYDMVKAVDKTMIVGEIRLLAKDGGKHGRWRAPGYEAMVL